MRLLRSRFLSTAVGRGAVAILYDSPNGLILVAPEDLVFARQLGHAGKGHGLSNLKLLENYISTESRVLFVGAHLGTLLIPVARRVRHVVGVEANPRTFRLLELNLRLNEISNATVVQYAAGDHEGEVDFLLSRVNTGGSKIKPDREHYEFTYDSPTMVKVPMRPLDDLFHDQDFDVIIVDIEGAETLALRGMQRLLSRCRFLQVEYMMNHLEKVANVTTEDFLRTIEPHFARMFILGQDPPRFYGPEQFLQVAERLGSGDLVFVK